MTYIPLQQFERMLKHCNPRLATWIEVFRVALFVNEFYPDVEGFRVFTDWWNSKEPRPRQFGPEEVLRHAAVFPAVDREALQTSVYWYALGSRWKPLKSDKILSEKQLLDIAKHAYKLFYNHNDWKHEIGSNTTLETFRFLHNCADNGRLPIRLKNDTWPEYFHQDNDAIVRLHDVHLEFRFWLARQPNLTYSAVVRSSSTVAFTRAMPWQPYMYRRNPDDHAQKYIKLPGRSQAVEEIKWRADAIAEDAATKDWIRKKPSKPSWTWFQKRGPRIPCPKLAIYEAEYLEAEKRRKRAGALSPANQRAAKPERQRRSA